MNPRKAPGPDGFHALFFQKHWSKVKRKVVYVALEFLNKGKLEDGLNETEIALIPKVHNPERMEELRPISLCNVVMKVITKVLANRLKLILPDIISDRQSAFVPGRLITDNIIIAQEMSHFIRRKKEGKRRFMSLKLDMSKAYDRVEWSFLRAIMSKMGFAGKWVNKVMHCMESVTYEVKINGAYSQRIKPNRGLRQGDPLSPYLFLICTEGLCALLDEYRDVGLLKGVKVCPAAPEISGLLFADDCILYAEATTQKASAMKALLNEYGRASGQVINYTKSEVCFSRNLEEGMRKPILDIIGVKEVKHHSKYLGLPLEFGQHKVKAIETITEKLGNRIKDWKEGMLSSGGKEIMIKAILQGMPQFAMSCLLLPKAHLNKIRSTISNFWWGRKAKEKSIHWVKWNKLVEAREDGGLGFQDMEALNLAFLGKQIWRCLTQGESLVARVLKAKYFRDMSILEARVGRNPSYCWRSIHSSIELLKKGLNFDSGGNCWSWSLEDAGSYSVSSAYKLALREINLKRAGQAGEQSSQTEKEKFWKKVWGSLIPNKVKHCGWRFFHSSLPDAHNLRKRGVLIDEECCLCGKTRDSAFHCVASCLWAKSFWEECGLGKVWLNREEGDAGDWLWWWHKKLNKEEFEKLLMGIWVLWKCRNLTRFENACWSPAQAALYGENFRREFKKASKCMKSDLLSSRLEWEKPDEGTLKINTDGAFLSSNSSGGGGFIVRDHNGQVTFGYCWPESRALSALEMEIKAFSKAISWAKNKKLQKVAFECDSMTLVEALVKGRTMPGNLKNLVARCNSALEARPHWSCQHIMRSGNVLADTLASYGSTCITKCFNHCNLPVNLAAQARKEAGEAALRNAVTLK